MSERGAGAAPVRYRFAGGAAELPQVLWAVGELGARLRARGIDLLPEESPEVGRGLLLRIGLSDDRGTLPESGVTRPETAESFAIFRAPEDGSLCLCGADMRGLVYALTELADRVRYAADLSRVFDFPEPLVETPTASVRSISKCFQSETEDLPWFHDRAGWKAYLTHLVTHRFNRFALTLGMQYNYPYGNEFLSDVYFYLAYPFLVAPSGHDVAISNLSAEERARNLESLKFIAREAERRGLQFQLALWTQSYDFDECPNAKHQIAGLGPENIAAYCRDSLALILAEVPEISGLTLRVHVECGIPEGAYDFWRTYFSAVTGAGRTIRLDLHAKGIDPEMIATALATGMPVGISPKYTSEHMGLPYHQMSVRALELPVPTVGADGRIAGRELATLYSGPDAEKHLAKWKFSEGSRKFMRYSYGDLLREDRDYDIMFRIWPGTTRVLLWGDPSLSGGYGRHSTFCGAQGVELCEPLSFKGRMGTGIAGTRTGYREGVLDGREDWRKFDYTYRVWGRSLYDPEADPSSFRRYLDAEYGLAGEAAGDALAAASRILPLITLAHTPTASNNSYWPEMYENMSILHEAPELPYGYELFKPKRFGTVGACDPQFFHSPAEFAAALHAREPVRKIAPLTWANWLDRFAHDAAAALSRAEAADPDAKLRLLAVDVTILAAIGKFFAAKIRAAVFWEYYLLSGAAEAGSAAVERYREARGAWEEAAEVCREVYQPDITYGPHSWLRGRWDDRLPAIEKDVADMEAKLAEGSLTRADAGAVARRHVELIASWSASQQEGCGHTVSESFVRGETLDLSLTPSAASRRTVILHYRHVNQAEPWRSSELVWRDGQYRAAIPADYTQSPYPLIYYFEFCDHAGSSFFPGLNDDLSNSPYFCLR